jgi:acetate kinase
LTTVLIFVVNAGSSSVKFALFEDAGPLPLVLKGSVSGLPDDARLTMRSADGGQIVEVSLEDRPIDAAAALRRVIAELRGRAFLERVGAVGHRIVHGGRTFTSPTRLDAATIEALERLAPLAPLHQPFNLALVAVTQEALPHAAHAACFDTGFHATQPRLARLYGLPRALSDDGVLGYGFHGLSYAFIASTLRARYGSQAGGRVIVAHLGSGVSLCALAQGQSVATTMGFSVLDGPPMSTRCGTLDPGVVLHLIQERGMSPEAVRDLLYERSGWLGVSGISGDMPALLRSEDPRAQEAIDLFVYRVAREIGSLAAALGGLDRLVFTGGIGEHADVIRARICERAAWIGVRVDAARNTRADVVISADDSIVEVLVIPTDEERVIAEGVRASVASEGSRTSPAGR